MLLRARSRYSHRNEHWIILSSKFSCISSLYFQKENILSKLWSLLLKKHIRKFRRMNLCHQKGKQAIRRITMLKNVDLLRRLCLERWLPKSYNSWSTTPSKLLLYISRIIFEKSHMIWQDPKEVLTSLKKLMSHQRLFFPLMCIFTCWERKQHLLYPVLD